MAILIECDRCGTTTRLIVAEPPNGPGIPTGWMRLPSADRNVPNPMGVDGSFEGGEFCRDCAMDLISWRKPIPKALPMDAELSPKLA